MSSTTYTVSGMTCSVAVDGTGFTDDAVDAAIQEAGYTLVR